MIRGKFLFFTLLLTVFSIHTLAGGQQAKFTGQVNPQPDIADLAQALSPTVVYIESTESSDASRVPNDPFHRFFQERQGEQPPRVGAGSGVIVSKDGYIITNYHVVEDTKKIQVTLNDERVFDAKLVGFDEEIDLAVLQISADNLTYAPLGDSGDLRVGEWVIAIGAPLGYRYTVTQGIVSALNRGGTVRLNQIENYIQTDAAINRGNSGGPLINMKGRIIGINTAISAMGQNIGFAIPINLIKGSFDQIVETGSVSRGALGVQISSLSSEAKEFFGVTHGALVGNVTKDSPAEKAGIKAGDLLITFDGQEILDSGHLISMVAVKRPGDTITVKMIQKGAPRTLKITLGDRAELVSGSRTARPQEGRPEVEGSSYSIDSLGLVLDYTASESAWIITKVKTNSPASEKGIRPGWKILKINQKPLNKTNGPQLFSDLKESKDVVLIEIENERGVQLIFLKPQFQE